MANITAGSRARVEELRVRPLGSTGFGNYECVANNEVGVQSAAAEFSGKWPIFIRNLMKMQRCIILNEKFFFLQNSFSSFQALSSSKERIVFNFVFFQKL